MSSLKHLHSQYRQAQSAQVAAKSDLEFAISQMFPDGYHVKIPDRGRTVIEVNLYNEHGVWLGGSAIWTFSDAEAVIEDMRDRLIVEKK